MSALLAIGLGLVLLHAGAESLVRGSRALALRAGLSPMVAGLTFVAYGTSAPELVVSVREALYGHHDIALGNVVGSNICNVMLILGLCGSIRPMNVHAQLLRVDVPLLVIVSLAVCALLLFDELGRAAGVCLIAGLVAYTVSSIRRAKYESTTLLTQAGEALPAPGKWAWMDAATAITGLGLLLGGSFVFLFGAKSLAQAFGLPASFIGLTAVAVGTSLPELASSLLAAIRGNGDIAIGNVVGSNLFNALGVLGLVAVIGPIRLDGVAVRDLVVMLAAAVALLAMLHTRRRLGRWEGGALLACYVIYLPSLLP